MYGIAVGSESQGIEEARGGPIASSLLGRLHMEISVCHRFKETVDGVARELMISGNIY